MALNANPGGMSNEGMGALVGGAANIIGALLTARGQGKISKEQLQAELAKARAGIYQAGAQNTLEHSLAREQQQRLGAGQVLGAIGPHDLAKGRQGMAIQRALLFGGPGGAPQQMRGPGIGSQYQANLPNVSGAAPFFSDSAILASEEPFWNATSLSTRGAIRPGDLSEAGFDATAASKAGNRMTQFADKIAGDDTAEQSRVRGALDNAQAQSLAALDMALGKTQQKSGGSGFWGKLGKGLLGAGAAAAGLFTGGASLTALPAILGMGAAGVGSALGSGNPLLSAGMNFAGGLAGAGQLPGRGGLPPAAAAATKARHQ
jgi:hypothetical protein